MARNNSSKHTASASNRSKSGSASSNASRNGPTAGPVSPRSKSSPRSGGKQKRRQQSHRGQPTRAAASPASHPSNGFRSIGSQALSAVAEHPIPIAMIGAGLAMLLLENRTGLANAERRMMTRGREMIGEVGESLAEYGSVAPDALSGAAG